MLLKKERAPLLWFPMLLVLMAGPLVASTDWQALGPEGGAVRSLLADPTDDSTVWAGTSGGAVFVSRNRGDSWSVAADGFAGGPVLDLQRQPVAGEPLYAVAQSGVYRLDGQDGSWAALSLPPGDRWTRFQVDPTSPRRVWAVVGGPTFDQDALLRSDDRGLTWTRVSTQPFSSVTPLAVLPTTPPTILTSFGGRLQKSTDGGTTWSQSEVANGWVANVSSFEVDPTDPTTVYAVAGPLQLDPPELVGLRVLKSVDAGSTWQDAGAGLPDASQYLTHDLEVDPTDPMRLYLSLDWRGTFVSRDGGSSWSPYDGYEASSLLEFEPVHYEISASGAWAWSALAIETSRPLARSPGPGTLWQRLPGFAEGSTIEQLLLSQTQEGEWLLRLGDGRLALTADAGDSWTFPTAALEGRRALAVGQDPSVADALLLSSSAFADPLGRPYQMHRSDDGGRSWTLWQDEMPDRIRSLVADPFVADRWFGIRDYSELVVSVDGGRTWGDRASPCGGPNEISPSPHVANTLLIGCVRDSGLPVSPPIHHADIWRSIDGGETWTEVQPVIVDVVSREGWSIAWDPSEPDVVLAGRAGIGFDTVLRSDDAGASFEGVTPADLRARVTGVALSPFDDTALVATAGDGVWRVTPSGWVPLRAGLTSQTVLQVGFDPIRQRRLLAGTRGGGLHLIEDVAPPRCAQTASRTCLRDRFVVEVYRYDGEEQVLAGALSLADGTAGAWWFDPDNLELAVKVVDGRTVNGHWWVFVGAMTDQRYHVAIEDLQTGVRKVWDGRQGQQQSLADIEAFADGAAQSARLSPRTADPRADAVDAALELRPREAEAIGTSLVLGPYRLELQREVDGALVHATPQVVNGQTGSFWWFESSSLDLFVKVLDGRPINGRWWLYVGSLTDVAFELVVTNVETGAERRYQNPQGVFAGFADIELPE